jgi:electron transfer flavoprotein alpha subunit
MTVFCLVELDGGAADGGPAVAADVSLRAITLARGLAAPGGVAAVVFVAGAPAGGAELGVGPGLVADLAAYGVTDVYAVAGIDGYAPLAWARVLQWLVSESLNPELHESPGESSHPAPEHPGHAVVAAGTERGNEVLAHLGAITGLPMAANCTQAVDNGDGT